MTHVFLEYFFPAVFTISAVIQGVKWARHHLPKFPEYPDPKANAGVPAIPAIPHRNIESEILQSMSRTTAAVIRRTTRQESLILIMTVSLIAIGKVTEAWVRNSATKE